MRRFPTVRSALSFGIALAALLGAGGGERAGAVWAADNGGRVEVFLRGSVRGGAGLSVRFTAAVALADGGAERALELSGAAVEGSALRGQQQPLASGDLPAGLYRGLRLVVAPDRGEATEVELRHDFRVWRGETATLVVEWDLERARRGDGSLASEALGLRSGARTVRRLTLYVTDEAADRVVAVNRDTDEVFSVISVGRRPRGIDVDRDGRRAFVANSGDDTVSVLDTTEHRVVDTLPLKSGSAPVDVAAALDGRRLAVSCPGINVVAVIDAVTNAYLGEIALSRAPGRLAVSSDGRTVYALAPEGNQVIAIDVQRLASGRTASVEAEPTDVVVDRFSGKVFVTHAHAPLVSVLSADLSPQERLQLGSPSFGAALEADGRRLFLAGGDAGGLLLVGPLVGAVIRRWASPPTRFVALDPDGRKLYATGGAKGTLIVLDRIAGRLIGEVKVGRSAVDLVVVP